MNRKRNFKFDALSIIITIGIIVVLILIIPAFCGFKFGYFGHNLDTIYIITQLIGITISSVLTFLIITQTKQISCSQIDLEKKKLKSDLFDRRFEVLREIEKIFRFVIQLSSVDKEFELIETGRNYKIKEYDIVIKIKDLLTLSNNKSNDINEYRVLTAQHLFDGKLLEFISAVFKEYSEIINKISDLSTIHDPLSAQVKYTSIITKCEEILEYRDKIKESSKIELNIAGLER